MHKIIKKDNIGIYKFILIGKILFLKSGTYLSRQLHMIHMKNKIYTAYCLTLSKYSAIACRRRIKICDKRIKDQRSETKQKVVHLLPLRITKTLSLLLCYHNALSKDNDNILEIY